MDVSEGSFGGSARVIYPLSVLTTKGKEILETHSTENRHKE